MYAFAAYDLRPTNRELQDDEELEVMETPLSEAYRMIQDRQIQDGKTIATLLAYERFFRQPHEKA
jgi:hypothetical protein